jgi:hypothetical protein
MLAKSERTIKDVAVHHEIYLIHSKGENVSIFGLVDIERS